VGVNLKKGQGVNLCKSEFDLSEVTIGLGWDVAEVQPGFFGKLLGKKEEEYDLDAVAFLLNEQGLVADLGKVEGGKSTLSDGDVIYFGSMQHRSGCISLTGDNRTGAGDGDDEQIIVNLNHLPDGYQKVVFIVQIYQGVEKGQNFSKINNAFIRAVDKKGTEMVRFDLSGEPAYSNFHSIKFAELERHGTEWKFSAVGTPYSTDNFVHILREYIQ